MTTVGNVTRRDSAERSKVAWWGGIAGPVLAAVVLATSIPGLSTEAQRVLAVTVWTAVWWITEAIPIPATSLLPALLFPLLGITTASVAAGYYMHHLILLLLGGFIIARSIETSGLHRRIALNVVSLLGDGPRALVLGFLFSSALLSMWISNTATTLMLVPIALSVVDRLGKQTENRLDLNTFAACLLLAVAYGANIGGVGTLIGTPPNLIFSRVAEGLPEQSMAIDFRSWLGFGFPIVLVFVPITGLLLTRVLLPLPATRGGEGAAVIAEERAALGKFGSEEKRVLAVFLVTALLWITRGGKGVPGWGAVVAGWSGLDPEVASSHITDSAVALAAALSLFLIPARPKGPPILDWKKVEGIPWGILLLLGGGFAIAGGFRESGLSAAIGESMASWLQLPTGLLVGSVSLLVTFLTELTSNTASTELLMPILAAASLSGEIAPMTLMLPAVLSVSFAFMLPVATAPNSIVFASGKIPIRTMLRCGFVLNLVGVLVVLTVIFGFVGPILGVPIG